MIETFEPEPEAHILTTTPYDESQVLHELRRYVLTYLYSKDWLDHEEVCFVDTGHVDQLKILKSVWDALPEYTQIHLNAYCTGAVSHR